MPAYAVTGYGRLRPISARNSTQPESFAGYAELRPRIEEQLQTFEGHHFSETILALVVDLEISNGVGAEADGLG